MGDVQSNNNLSRNLTQKIHNIIVDLKEGHSQQTTIYFHSDKASLKTISPARHSKKGRPFKITIISISTPRSKPDAVDEIITQHQISESDQLTRDWGVKLNVHLTGLRVV